MGKASNIQPLFQDVFVGSVKRGGPVGENVKQFTLEKRALV